MEQKKRRMNYSCDRCGESADEDDLELCPSCDSWLCLECLNDDDPQCPVCEDLAEWEYENGGDDD